VISDLRLTLAQRVTDLPYIADLLARLQQQRQDLELRKAQNYSRSPRAVELATQYALHNAELRKLVEMSQSKLRFYETMFPWLEDFSGQTLEAVIPEQSRAEKLHNRAG
jgi:DNA-binding transcriptional MerR regulator